MLALGLGLVSVASAKPDELCEVNKYHIYLDNHQGTFIQHSIPSLHHSSTHVESMDCALRSLQSFNLRGEATDDCTEP